jgi:hypothetical protein
MARNPERAADLMQETLAEAWAHQSKFKDGTNLRAWLSTITKATVERSVPFKPSMAFRAGGHGTGSHLALQSSPKFGRHIIELGGRDLQFAMRCFQTNGSTAWFRGCILEGSTRNAGDPQRAHEFEPRKSGQIFGVRDSSISGQRWGFSRPHR